MRTCQLWYLVNKQLAPGLGLKLTADQCETQHGRVYNPASCPSNERCRRRPCCCVSNLAAGLTTMLRGAAHLQPLTANVSCTPHRTPPYRSADLAFGGSGNADTANSCSTRAAAEGRGCDYGIRLMNRRKGHGLCPCCDG
jgi:hypothetical protein